MPSQPKKDSGNTIPRARGYGANLTDREQGEQVAKEHQARGCKAKAYCMLCKRKKEKDCDQPTFSKAGTSSIIDLTFVNAGLASDSSWEVSDTYTSSDHATIICTINSRNGPPRVPKTVPG